MISLTSENYTLSVGRIALAHEFTITDKNKCDYSRGRGIYGISLALSGEAEYRFSNGERYTVREGDLIFLPNYAAYTISVGSPYRHYTVNFTAEGELSATGGMIIHTTENTSAYKDAFRKIIAERESRAVGFELRSLSALYSLFGLLLSEMADKENTSVHRKRLLAVKQYIDKNYKNETTLEQLAEVADMSVTNFRRLFLREFGRAPIKYRDEVRLSAAKEALTSGYITVSEAAELSGFEDTAYFVRFFKKHTGITPGAFKNSPYDNGGKQ